MIDNPTPKQLASVVAILSDTKALTDTQRNDILRRLNEDGWDSVKMEVDHIIQQDVGITADDAADYRHKIENLDKLSKKQLEEIGIKYVYVSPFDRLKPNPERDKAKALLRSLEKTATRDQRMILAIMLQGKPEGVIAVASRIKEQGWTPALEVEARQFNVRTIEELREKNEQQASKRGLFGRIKSLFG